ncbi:MAG: sensor histidine kinase, partial [Limisphaerales bacterium]
DYVGHSDTRSNRVVLAFQVGDRFLTAQLEDSAGRQALPALEPGSLVRLVGVSDWPPGGGAARVFSLLLRSPADIQVLGPGRSIHSLRPQLLAATAILTAIALATALLFLQKQRRRTEHLLEFQVSLQADMRQSEQQLRRSIEERERIGRNLHDDVIQSIYAVGLKLEDCRRVLRESAKQAEPRLAAAIDMLNATIRSVRGFIAGLEPKVLDGREFKTALKSLALTSGDSPARFQIEIDTPEANRLTPVQATELLRIAKEAISNSLRHAHASTVRISLQRSGRDAQFEVADDGIGFDHRTYTGSGHGLRNMGARAGEIGGELQIR